MKKILSVVMCIIVILNILLVSAVSINAETGELLISNGGKTYQAKVGQKFTYTYYLNVSQATKNRVYEGVSSKGYISNIDMHLEFDKEYLRMDYDAKTFKTKSFPILSKGSLISNINDKKGMLFNASTVAWDYGFDSNDKVLVTLTFEAIKAGKVEIKADFVTMCALTIKLDPIVSDHIILDEFYGNEVIDLPAIDSIRGDANRDKIVDVVDATWIQKYCAKLVLKENIDLLAADVNLDGYVDVVDSTRIQKYKAKLCNIDGSTPYNPNDPSNP